MVGQDNNTGGHDTAASLARNANNDSETPFLEEGTPMRRDGHTASPSSDDADKNVVHYIEILKGLKKTSRIFKLIVVPPNDDPTMAALFATFK